MGAIISKRYFVTVSVRFQPNGMINMIVMGEFKLLLTNFMEIFVNTGPYGAGNFKTLLLIQFFKTLWLSDLLYSFHQISTKHHTKYHNQGRMQAITFMAIRQKL